MIVRVFVDDLDAALPLYFRLAGVSEAKRFEFGEVQLAGVGSFLLLSGNTAPYRDRVATLVVAEMEQVIAALQDTGGTILDGPSPTPNGNRLIARHPDGSVFEYIEKVPAP
ncbi:hypothetical protein V1227_11610 [Lentzea sp. DG1S-22]|uniref:VOC family protein n=1 Tax=Lentzea sp. DG1S-22 TaxID=3108822 RepID=UPI002E771155|nr:hypothetical protein [Lentzea sp. DG1S-22]WVH83364.1 hypothetical protein V1227_11610 [Lentzea sp. DG1S-22]